MTVPVRSGTDVRRWRFGSPWFVTADDPDYAAAANWHRARFVPDEDDPPGEWRNRSEEAPEGGFEGPPCGNISWWDGEGKNVVTFEGPHCRALAPTSTGAPTGYTAVPSPDNDVLGDTRPARWTMAIWDGGRRLTAPHPVVGACKRGGTLIVICAPTLASSAVTVSLIVYSRSGDAWVQRLSYSHADLLYPSAPAACNRAATEARIVMQINPPDLPAGSNWIGGGLANRELIIDLTAWSVSVGRDFDPDRHHRTTWMDYGGTEALTSCGEELLAVDWTAADERVECWLSRDRRAQATVGHDQFYLHFVGGGWNGERIYLESNDFDVPATRLERANVCYLDLRGPVLLLRRLDDLGQHDYWLLRHDDETITEPDTSVPVPADALAVCVIDPAPGYDVDYVPWTSLITVESPGVPGGIDADYLAMGNTGRVCLDATYTVFPPGTGHTIRHLTDATDESDPGPEFGLAPGASVNPIRFGYRK